VPRRGGPALRVLPRRALAFYFSNAAFDELDDLGVPDVQIERILGDEKA
jgi:hypothetical protein